MQKKQVGIWNRASDTAIAGGNSLSVHGGNDHENRPVPAVILLLLWLPLLLRRLLYIATRLNSDRLSQRELTRDLMRAGI